MNKPHINLKKPGTRHTITAIASVLTAVGVIAALTWSVGEPHAEKYIRDIMDESGVVKQADVKQLEDQVEDVKREIDHLDDRARETERQVRENGAKLDITIQLQREVRQYLMNQGPKNGNR